MGIPIAGLPEPTPSDTGTAYYRRCMGVNCRADGAGTAADAGPGGAPATRLRHAAVCGAAAALCVSILTDVHRFLAALRENLCPVFGCARSQEALEERRNRWRHRRETD